jgi:hypothetical protein
MAAGREVSNGARRPRRSEEHGRAGNWLEQCRRRCRQDTTGPWRCGPHHRDALRTDAMGESAVEREALAVNNHGRGVHLPIRHVMALHRTAGSTMRHRACAVTGRRGPRAPHRQRSEEQNQEYVCKSPAAHQKE